MIPRSGIDDSIEVDRGSTRHEERGRRAVGLLAMGGLLLGICLWGAVWFFTGMPGSRRAFAAEGLTEQERALAERLRAHVEALAAGPRTAADEGAQQRALAWAERHLREAGLAPRLQPTVTGRPPALADQSPARAGQVLAAEDGGLPNLLAEVPGRDATLPRIVVGAHYDTVPGSPGADDNASGVAVLLELARLRAGRPVPRGVIFALFSEEEVDMRGSRFLAADLRARVEGVEAMMSLEMLGYYRDEQGSQRYPAAAMGLLYPRRANFVAMVGNLRSRSLLRECVSAFRRAVPFPCEGLAAPDALRDIFRSDNASFWHEGFPAVMVTDTSNFRNPNYHTPTDVPSTLDYAAMARVTLGLDAVLDRLSTR